MDAPFIYRSLLCFAQTLHGSLTFRLFSIHSHYTYVHPLTIKCERHYIIITSIFFFLLKEKQLLIFFFNYEADLRSSFEDLNKHVKP